jgi:UDP-GlcNAc:undecaprenyl-phosphate GlcNAc-1-phosphate transferase
MLFSFFTTTVIAMMSWPIALFVGSKLNIIDYPSRRKVHSSPTLRTGGILIFFGFIVGVLLLKVHFHLDFLSIIFFATFIFAMGLIDDKYKLNAKTRLILQGVIACLCILTADAVLKHLGLFALPVFIRIPFTIFAVVGVINAFNIIDGLNGLASGLGIIAASSIGILAYQYNDHELYRLSIIFTGALVGFIIFNLKGKIFMGDSGSYLVGFMIAVLSIMLVNRNSAVSPFAPFLIILIPIFDTLFAIYRRRRLKRDPFKADRRHLHHILRRRYNSNARAVLVILSMQTVITLMAVLLCKYTIPLVVIAVFAGLFLRRLWFKKIRLGVISL